MKKNSTVNSEHTGLSEVQAFLFDLDGTLYLGDRLIDGAIKTLEFLRGKGKRIVFLTNNSSRTNDEYYNRLVKMGLFGANDSVYSSLDSFIDYMKENCSEARIYALAGNTVKKYIKDKGLNVVSAKKADTLLTTFDKTLTYKKIVDANILLNSGARYIATHPDLVCPDNPYSVPDLGSFTEMFYLSSGRRPDVITGKPYSVMAKCICKKLNLPPEKIVMTGDRLNTDIAFGVNGGFKTVLVLSGETDVNLYKKSEIKADYVINSVAQFKDIF